MDANSVMKQVAGKRQSKKGRKGLPKRTGNPTRKMRMKRSQERMVEKKLRHVIRRNGIPAAKVYCDVKGIGISVLRRLCIQMDEECPA